MEEDSNANPRDPFEGKKIKLASTAGIDLFTEVGEELMREVFGFEPGEYLITDETSLADFEGVNEMELPDIHKKIRDLYGIDVSDTGHGNLLEILGRVHRAKYGRPSGGNRVRL